MEGIILVLVCEEIVCGILEDFENVFFIEFIFRFEVVIGVELINFVIVFFVWSVWDDVIVEWLFIFDEFGFVFILRNKWKILVSYWVKRVDIYLIKEKYLLNRNIWKYRFVS